MRFASLLFFLPGGGAQDAAQGVLHEAPEAEGARGNDDAVKIVVFDQDGQGHQAEEASAAQDQACCEGAVVIGGFVWFSHGVFRLLKKAVRGCGLVAWAVSGLFFGDDQATDGEREARIAVRLVDLAAQLDAHPAAAVFTQ